MAGRIQRTLLLIQPDAVEGGHVSDILDMLDMSGFFICRKLKRTLSVEDINVVFRQHVGQKHFQSLSDHLLSSPSVTVELSCIDAVSKLLDLVGPASVARARKYAPRTIRGRFGVTGLKCAVHASNREAKAKEDIDTLFPSVMLENMLPHEYLSATVLPTVNAALEQLCTVKPMSPQHYLIEWLRDHRPLNPSELLHPKAVLEKSNVLRYLVFQNIHNEKKFGRRISPDIWNFRQCKKFGDSALPISRALVYGVGLADMTGWPLLFDQCCKSSCENILILNLSDAFYSVVENKFVVLRGSSNIDQPLPPPYELQHTNISGIERRFAFDIAQRLKLHEANFTTGKINRKGAPMDIYRDTGLGETIPTLTYVKHVPLPPEDAFSNLAQDYVSQRGVTVSYARIPLSPESFFEGKANLTYLSETLTGITKTTAVLCCCHSGRSRTTVGMVCSMIAVRQTLGVCLVSNAKMNSKERQFDSRSLFRGEYACIMQLMQCFGDLGHAIKTETDQCVSLCASGENIISEISLAQSNARSIAEKRILATLKVKESDDSDESQDEDEDASEDGEDHEEKGRSEAFWIRRATAYLRRYYMILVFTSFIHLRKTSNETFDEYLNEHEYLLRGLRRIQLE